MAVLPGPVAVSTDAERAMYDFVDAYDRGFQAAAEEHGLSVAQACVLSRLTEPRGMGELAAELGCDASNITQIVGRLEARDLVVRRPHPYDRRSRQILRTARGDALCAAFEESFEFPRTAVSQLDASEQRQLTSLLRKALTNAADPRGRR